MQARYLTIAACVLLCACGPKTPEKPPEPATLTVLIGVAGPLTGPIAHQGKDDENGVALAIEQANARHLVIGGKPATFKMVSEDDQGDPKVGTTVAQKLIDAHVAAVIGHLNSGVTIPASELYNKAGIPVITGSATSPELTERGMNGVFRTIGRDDQQGPAIAAYIVKELKAKKVAIVDDKTAYGEGLATEVEGALREAGETIAGRERTTDKETDFKAILTRIKGKSPDVVFYGGMDSTGGLLLKQARELGVKAAFAFGDGACTDEMAQLAGPAGEGLACSQAGLPASSATKEFRDAFTAKYGETKLYAPFFYDATNVVIDAMVRADSADPARFAPEMSRTKLKGATGPIEFDAKGDRKDAEMTIFRMKDGKIVPVMVYRAGKLTAFGEEPAAESPPPPPQPRVVNPTTKPKPTTSSQLY
jgi:branched-chain amino acid transport system substrate-binding protein